MLGHIWGLDCRFNRFYDAHSVKCVNVDSYKIKLVDCRQGGKIWSNLYKLSPILIKKINL